MFVIAAESIYKTHDILVCRAVGSVELIDVECRLNFVLDAGG